MTLENEVKNMTNLETAALVEVIRIIVEKSQSKEEIEKALERIQDHLNKTK